MSQILLNSFFNVLDARGLLFNLCNSRFANFATKKLFLPGFGLVGVVFTPSLAVVGLVEGP